MIVNQAFRYELDPNTTSRGAPARPAGTARFAYDWGLELCRACLEAEERLPGGMTLHRLWNRWKGDKAPWWAEVSKRPPREALRDPDRAFRNFWRGRKAGRPVDFPRFRKKGRDDRFRLTGAVSVLPRAVVLPRPGPIRTKEPTVKSRGRILSVTVGREADRWYVSLTVERERTDPALAQGPVVASTLGWIASRCCPMGPRYRRPNPWPGTFAGYVVGAAPTAGNGAARPTGRNRGPWPRYTGASGRHRGRGPVGRRDGPEPPIGPRYRRRRMVGVSPDAGLQDHPARFHLTLDRDLNAALNLERLVAGSSPETQDARGADVRPA